MSRLWQQQTAEKIDHYLLKEEKGFQIQNDIFDLLDNSYDMMFLCNPNNPTGIPVEKEFVLRLAGLCAEKGIYLMIDECFCEFLDEEENYSIMASVDQLEKVIILKAFTKIYAMAGLRLGYCICSDEETADLINGCLQPWSVSTPASKSRHSSHAAFRFCGRNQGLCQGEPGLSSAWPCGTGGIKPMDRKQTTCSSKAKQI